MLRGTFILLVAFAVAAVLWTTQCSGPRPSVVGAPRVSAPAQTGDPYRVEATIRNTGTGHGEARAVIRLVDVRTREAYQQQTPVQLEPGETARVAVEIPAPPGDYEPEVEVEYPPT